ncbi:hypothetical protein DFH08DRAFT_986623 [Mycena albidolilacea]|uniref:Uncharacterized protein n=1 Tax=Mycena albidolilacea TaxID=1033008 RepID=A0AAD6Z104_9AGAR|nr:hypothetical protein DFH08DRAFT_986623 [Mycena albidolilacea]
MVQVQSAHLEQAVRQTAIFRAALTSNVMDEKYKDLDPVRLRRYLNCGLSGVIDRPNRAKVRLDFHVRNQEKTLYTYRSEIGPIGSLHIDLPFEAEEPIDEDGNPAPAVTRNPGKDPALWFAQCGPSGRHSIYLMLPDLKDTEPELVQKIVYESVYAAIEATTPEMVPGQVPRYEDEVGRQAGFGSGRGRHSQSRKIIPSRDGAEVGRRVAELILAQPWGSSAYWLLQIRGVKDETRHPASEDRVADKLHQLLRDVRSSGAHTYVDVAIEIHPPDGWGVLLLRNGHEELLRRVVGIPEDKVPLESKRLDVWSGVASTAGAHWDWADDPKSPSRISYAQLYVSDKALLYNAGLEGRMPVLNATHPLKMVTADQELTFLCGVYKNLHGGLQNLVPVATRFEVRVPKHYATTVFNGACLNLANFDNTVTVAKLTTIWGWRLERMMALAILFRAAAAQSTTTRSTPDHLKLIAVGTYVFNALNCTPGSMNNSRQLARAVWGTAVYCEDPQEVLENCIYSPTSPHAATPIMERGALWLPELNWPEPGMSNILRFRYSPTVLDEAQLSNIFGIPWSSIKGLFDGAVRNVLRTEGALQVRNVRPAKRIERRLVQLPGSFVVVTDEDPYDRADDLHPDARFGSPPPAEPMNVTQVFYEVISDVFQRLGVSQGGSTGYCRLTPEQRLCIGPETFQDLNLLSYFERGYLTNDRKTWEHIGNLLFPAPGAVGNYGKQGWGLAPAHKRYVQLVLGADRDKAIKVHTFCAALFAEFRWFPVLVLDKMFDYRSKTGPGWTAFGTFRPSSPRGVSVAWNPSKRSTPVYAAHLQPTLDTHAVQQWRSWANEAGETQPTGSGAPSHSRSRRIDIVDMRPPVIRPEIATQLARRSQMVRGRLALAP